MSRFDVTFVLPSLSVLRPPGGFDIVYHLSAYLARKGFRTGIVVPFKLRQQLAENFKLPELLDYPSTFHKLSASFHTISPKLGMMQELLFLVLRKLMAGGYEFSILEEVPIMTVSDSRGFKNDTDIIIATAWETAYFVDEFLRQHDSLGMYLIQNSEDESSYSGNASILASKTYTFDLRKIVINRRLYERFKKDDPFFFNVGFDNEKYRMTTGIEQRQNYAVLFPLRVNPSKGASYAIDAAKILKHKYPFVRVIAYGDYPRKCVPKWIEYHKRPSDSEIAKLYNESSIFVLPSLVEGMPVPPLEAMSSGCAVVSTDNGGIEEYLENDVNGLIVPTRDADAISSAVEKLITDVDLRMHLARNGRITSQAFTYDEMCKTFAKIIEQVITTRSTTIYKHPALH